VTIATSIPIIMGQNIGTCVTALISGIGASKNARRASLIHLYFNLIGTILFMVLFYVIHAVIPFAFMDGPAHASGIAMVHTVFNIFATIMLFPFSKLLVKLATMTIKDDPKAIEAAAAKDDDFMVLDPRFLDTPAFAIEQCRNVTNRMAQESQKALELAMGLIYKYDESVAAEVVRLEDVVDRYEDQLGSYLVKLSSKRLNHYDSNTLSLLLHCIGDYERISDHAVNIKEAAEEMYNKKVSFSDKAQEEMRVFSRALSDIVAASVKAFAMEDLQLATTIEPLEEVIDYLNSELKQRHIERLRQGRCTIELGFILTDIITGYERIADHCSNIACNLIEIRQDGYERHSYKDALKSGDNQEFTKDYKHYKEMYQLPKSSITTNA